MGHSFLPLRSGRGRVPTARFGYFAMEAARSATEAMTMYSIGERFLQFIWRSTKLFTPFMRIDVIDIFLCVGYMCVTVRGRHGGSWLFVNGGLEVCDFLLWMFFVEGRNKNDGFVLGGCHRDSYMKLEERNKRTRGREDLCQLANKHSIEH